MRTTMSSDRGKKLREIRKAEKLTQQQFADLTGISLGTVKNYEIGRFEVGLKVLDSVLAIDQFEKYMMWLMKDKTAPEVGQISPILSRDGSGEQADAPDSTPHTEKSHR
ncbi:helix-turn-helix transcriptional regulator [Klebsiella michiganensis]|uniref:helix-turn-helix domain-containing protein n=1 Tax=Klebsiella TaxID=570 RepID=UPI0027FF26BA|nr:helix-turn-helix transcriptional regulator [Klebsiella michiganensis]MDQ7855502.1 helix-turn-helix transcriptional regulator [Klebsiella michiganensis]